MVDVYKVDLTKDQLAAMPDDERGFFIFMGLATNEISCFSKLIIMTSNVRDRSNVIDHVQTGQAFILLRTLFGKCYEALKFLKHSPVAKRYWAALPDDLQKMRRSLDRTFKKGGVLEEIRNISFHYPSSDELNASFQALSPSDPYCFYLSKANSNSFYHFSELVAQRAMLGEIDPGADPDGADAERLMKALAHIFDTVTSVSKKLITVFEAYNEIFFEKYFPDAQGVQVMQLLDAPDLGKVGIPFFAEREGRT